MRRGKLRALGAAACWAALAAGPASGWEWPTPARPESPPRPEPSATPPRAAAEHVPPPAVEPFHLPTYDGQGGDFRAPVPELAPFPDIDTGALFRVVTNCFPERVPWGFEVKAVAGARYAQDNAVSTFDTAGLAKYYAGLVAEIPLYSASEVNAERRAEYQRRAQLSENIAALVKGLAAIRRAKREIGLYTAASLRSQARVREGMASTEEQLGQLEKVAEAYSRLDDAQAAVEGARLALYGQCRDEVAEEVNRYLLALVAQAVGPARIAPGSAGPP